MVGGGMAIAEIRLQPPGLVAYVCQSMCGVAWPRPGRPRATRVLGNYKITDIPRLTAHLTDAGHR